MGLSDIVTPSLARDVYTDVASLTTHSKASVWAQPLVLRSSQADPSPQVRKRAVLALFRIFEQYPDALRTGFTRLKDRLEDDDPGELSSSLESSPCSHTRLAFRCRLCHHQRHHRTIAEIESNELPATGPTVVRDTHNQYQ